MRLLQFSTSHYCRKARLTLGYKGISYEVENLTPGAHVLKLKPLVGTTTLPVLLPEQTKHPIAVGDSTAIAQFLEAHYPNPPLSLPTSSAAAEMWMIEDWLDESIGTATRFVYYDFRSKAGKSIDPSIASQLVIGVVRWQYGMNPTRVKLAEQRLESGVNSLGERWKTQDYLVGDRLTIADITAAALLSPLALIPSYRQRYPWLFDRICQVHHRCREPLPPGLQEEPWGDR
ncbi:MAG: glutathione S-transferase family protein [Leptolyngbyaceae cyanobacterium SL_7_1]|nr:glutathione S-transferase family protein [Leptolyngbyaceae cyanobacterium SL_7_1]